MDTRRILTTITTAATLAVGWLALPAPAAAHCDSLDGPVVRAARAALAQGNVDLVLVWVRAADEPEIREAFDRTLRIRSLGPDAAEVADRWFFETLVRVHRAGEGAPYTGLKPAGTEPEPGIAEADRALEEASPDSLASRLADDVAAAVAERWSAVRRLEGYDPFDVEAGREWVETYVRYIHFVEELVALVHADAGHAEEGSTAAPAHHR